MGNLNSTEFAEAVCDAMFDLEKFDLPQLLTKLGIDSEDDGSVDKVMALLNSGFVQKVSETEWAV